MIWVQFGYSDNGVVGLQVKFNKKTYYTIGIHCDQGEIPLEKLGADRNRIWTIEKDGTRVKLSCNGVEIVDLETGLSNEEECKDRWVDDFPGMRFIDGSDEDKAKDTASDYFRPYKAGMSNKKNSD